MKRTIWLFAIGIMLLTACKHDPHFITDKAYRNEVHHDFELRQQCFPMLALQFDTLTQPEREAMEFLYAYMPLSDLADYPPDYYLQQVRYAFRAREEMSWGQSIPEDIFRHFVLVYRVNNENLDTARILMFNELKERVAGLSMEEAALEVNHWCHEHVAYRASDSRTSSPLATMRTSLGRCGEESTFTVTALRSVGIPARQCYTPRWAHCDDNHAWVEVYVDGQWKYLGACEPDPHLNMGWFSIPSTRCMMVHSKAFGKYRGNEQVVKQTNLYSELNLLDHYAPTRQLKVRVYEDDNTAATGSSVSFMLYNYSEYYPLATLQTNESGEAVLTTGLGDLMIWATDGKRYAYQKIDVRKDSIVDILLPESPLNEPPYAEDFEIVPPIAGEPQVMATPEEAAANAKRLAYEDSLRAAYVASFHTNSSNPFIRKSEGNYAEIELFIDRHPNTEAYLSTFSDKDMRDITASVLEAHLTTKADFPNVGDEAYSRGLLPARISNELVRPYRAELSSFIGMNGQEILKWTLSNIKINDSANYYNCPISPMGVYRIRQADSHSRDIFFVATCRAAGIPAYLDNATNIAYFHDGTSWQKANFSNAPSPATSSTSTLTFTYHGTDPAQPTYWTHFTIARLEHGTLHTFDFENDPRLSNLPATLTLEPGLYCLSTGNRYPDGEVRSRWEFFELKTGQHLNKEIIILPLLSRTNQTSPIDKNLELFDGIELWDYAGQTGMLYINLGNYSEPSKHLIVELQNLQKEVKQWGGMTFMVGPNNIGMEQWKLVNTDLAYHKGALEKAILQATNSNNSVQYPLVALIDHEGKIQYHSQGYKIGVIEQVLKAACK